MTNYIAPAANTATVTRDPAEALTHGGRQGHSALSASRNHSASFQSILYAGVHMDAKDATASLSFVHLSAPDPSSAPDPDRAPRRPDDTADDDRDRDNAAGGGEIDRRDPHDQTEDVNPDAPAPILPVNAGGTPEDALDGAAMANAPRHFSADTSHSKPAARASVDTAGAPIGNRDAPVFRVDTDPRGAINAAANPATDSTPAPAPVGAAARQADDLARSLPAGANLKIDVTVAKTGDTFFSQPASSLAVPSMATGQKKASRPGEPPVGASAKAGFTAMPNPGQVPAGEQIAMRPNGGPHAGDLQLKLATRGNPSAMAAAQPRNAGTASAPMTGAFADFTGTASANAPGSAQRAASAPVSTPAKTPPPQPPVAEQISVQISKAVKAGIDRIEIQLRPNELGRVDVRLELAGDGRVTATVTADNRETLELLKTDMRGLEKALDDAGLKTDSNSLNFNLRGQNDRPTGNPLSQTDRSDGARDDGETEPDGRLPARGLGDYARGGLSADGRVDIEI